MDRCGHILKAICCLCALLEAGIFVLIFNIWEHMRVTPTTIDETNNHLGHIQTQRLHFFFNYSALKITQLFRKPKIESAGRATEGEQKGSDETDKIAGMK